MPTKYQNWIEDGNLQPFLTAVGWICDYKFDDDDWDAVQFGVKKVDEDQDRWFDYPLVGGFEILVRITMTLGSSCYTIEVLCDREIDRELQMIAGIAQCYRIQDF